MILHKPPSLLKDICMERYGSYRLGSLLGGRVGAFKRCRTGGKVFLFFGLHQIKCLTDLPPPLRVRLGMVRRLVSHMMLMFGVGSRPLCVTFQILFLILE